MCANVWKEANRYIQHSCSARFILTIMSSWIENVPAEVVSEIFGRLDLEDQCHFRLVLKTIEEQSRHAFAEHFVTVSVAITRFSLSRMVNISNKADFAKRVRNLQVYTI